MIQSITGKIQLLTENAVHIETNGIEYSLFASKNALKSFASSIGKTERVLTFLHISDRVIELFAFANPSERAMFLALLKVDGIGAKAAIKILSSTNPESFFSYLHAHDVKSLSSLPGIGNKKANKILVALENVFIPLDKKKDAHTHTEHSVNADILMALLSMGYDKAEVERILASVLEEYAPDEIKKNEASIIKKTIIQLAKNVL